MNILQAITLGVVQGLTEFIPVSSSGHLAIVPYILGWPTPSLVFDLALHFGTLIALLWFFREKILNILKSLVNYRSEKQTDKDNRWLALKVLIATVPGAIIGYLLKDIVNGLYKSTDAQTLEASIIYTATALTVLGAIFILSDYIFKNRKTKPLEKFTWWQALIVGLSQAVAVIRGVSRSGATLLTGQLLGLKRVDAAEFSFLMSIPIIAATSVFSIKELLSLEGDQLKSELGLAAVGALAAFISGVIAIRFLLQYLKHAGLRAFGWYRLFFGAIVLILVLAY